MENNYRIEKAGAEDLPVIYQLFEQAIAYQKSNNYVGWNGYDKEFIKREIQNGLQYKVKQENQIVAVFSVCLHDEFIWREKEVGNALYLHRVITNAAYKGQRQFEKVLNWAMAYAAQLGRSYIRIDTWLDNPKIIAFYKTYGFQFVETFTTGDTDKLPIQHRSLSLALLELKCAKKIYIIGAGAIGKALGVFLKLENKDVTILRGSIGNEESHIDKVTVTLPDGKQVAAELEISGIDNYDELDGIIVMAVKSFANASLAEILKQKSHRSPIVLLQNGLGVEQPFVRSHFPEIYRCVLFATSQTISPDHIRFKPVSASPVGVVSGSAEDLSVIVSHLHTQNFPFTAEADIQTVTWKKTIANCVFNSICPVLEVDNGIFYRNESVLAIAMRVVKECVAVAEKAGFPLQTVEVIDSLLKISRYSEGQLISTFQDLKNGRRTEIDTFNFAVADIARNSGLENAVVETRLLGELVKLKSEIHHFL